MYQSNLMKMLVVLALCVPMMGYAASDSSALHRISATPQKYQSYVNTNDCVTLKSSPYVIVGGIGGGKSDLTCPKSRPVMVNWKREEWYGGFISVSTGGGDAHAICCAVAYKWAS